MYWRNYQVITFRLIKKLEIFFIFLKNEALRNYFYRNQRSGVYSIHQFSRFNLDEKFASQYINSKGFLLFFQVKQGFEHFSAAPSSSSRVREMWLKGQSMSMRFSISPIDFPAFWAFSNPCHYTISPSFSNRSSLANIFPVKNLGRVSLGNILVPCFHF